MLSLTAQTRATLKRCSWNCAKPREDSVTHDENPKENDITLGKHDFSSKHCWIFKLH